MVTNSNPPSPVVEPPPNGAGWLLGATIAPAIAAAAIAVYLVVISLGAAGRPLGCGAGSGCNEVLSSRWSRVLGVPVGLPAAGLYLAVITAAAISARTEAADRRRLANAVLWIAAGAIVTSVAWFSALQWFDLGVFCPWCLADHALGLICATAILTAQIRQRRFLPLMFLIGVMLASLLATAQVVGPAPAAVVETLSDQQRLVLEGGLAIAFDQAPRIGATDAQHVVVLFDYCCPHCRQTHAQLLELQSQFPDRFAVVLLPVPLNHECNPHETETEPRFIDSCTLARLALATWRIDPARFAEFDRWLFTSPQPRPAAAAHAEAARLLGSDQLQAALQDPWIEQRLRSNVDAHAASQLEQIPVLLAPGGVAVSGRVTNAAELQQLLESDLGLSLSPAAAP